MIYLISGSVAGLLIGMVGIGGILLAPMLHYIAGVDLHLAMATSNLSFLFTGIAGTLAYSRKGTISWKMVLWLSVGIIPAALLGAKVNLLVPTRILTIILACLIGASGLNALRKSTAEPDEKSILSWPALILIGLIVGFGSALTGTGGPVLLLPIFMLINIPVLLAIGVSQVIQLPIAVFASTGYVLYGEIDIQLGVILGIIQATGVLVGAQIAHRLPRTRLRQIVAMTLVATGILMILRNLF
jgi:uncharacterized protein